MKRTVLWAIPAILLLTVVVASANPFVNGPPFAGPGKWPNHPGSRHFETDADTDSLSVNTVVGPEWDFDVWDCDDIIWNGGAGQGAGANWYDVKPSWVGHQGLVGIDNTQGTGPLVGSITFHINNFPDPRYIKYVWDEIIFVTTGTATIGVSLTAPPTVQNVGIQNFSALASLGLGYPATDPGHLQNLYGEVHPNPLWEEITYTFNVGLGEEAYIDSFEFATLCFPEPATMGLLSLGALGLSWLRKRRK